MFKRSANTTYVIEVVLFWLTESRPTVTPSRFERDFVRAWLPSRRLLFLLFTSPPPVQLISQLHHQLSRTQSSEYLLIRDFCGEKMKFSRSFDRKINRNDNSSPYRRSKSPKSGPLSTEKVCPSLSFILTLANPSPHVGHGGP